MWDKHGQVGVGGGIKNMECQVRNSPTLLRGGRIMDRHQFEHSEVGGELPG